MMVRIIILTLLTSCASAEAAIEDAGKQLEAAKQDAGKLDASPVDAREEVYVPMVERGPCKNCHKLK